MNKIDMSFEEAFSELESILARLEEGGLSLEESVTLFERGMALANCCETHLDKAELRVSQLIAGEDGSSDLEPC